MRSNTSCPRCCSFFACCAPTSSPPSLRPLTKARAASRLRFGRARAPRCGWGPRRYDRPRYCRPRPRLRRRKGCCRRSRGRPRLNRHQRHLRGLRFPRRGSGRVRLPCRRPRCWRGGWVSRCAPTGSFGGCNLPVRRPESRSCHRLPRVFPSEGASSEI